MLYDNIKQDTFCGVVDKSFDNTGELQEQLGALPMPEFFARLKEKVALYYVGQ
jgi:CRISPR-associated protein Cst2